MTSHKTKVTLTIRPELRKLAMFFAIPLSSTLEHALEAEIAKKVALQYIIRELEGD